MSQPSPQASYLFDRGQADQDRLIRSSEVLGEFVTEACVRAGLASGGRTIDIGCGPLGALPALADRVGSEGRVVGLDTSGEALALARTILDERGCTTVTLVQAALDTVGMSDLCPPGPFDLAYTRRFLVHQPDPAGCLRRIASLVRPGGRIIAHEIPPGSGYPALTPPVPALQRVDELVHAGVRARGGRYDAAHHFAALCRDAGLRLLSQRGFVPAAEPLTLLENFQAVLRSLRSVILSQGITTEHELEALLGGLEDAKAAQYISSFANLYIEMIAEVPSRQGSAWD
jgi:SAM-dependent methyltransferase